MARLPIRTFPDPVLLLKAEPVTTFGEPLMKLARDMGETMYAADGVGLAAPQVGLALRLIVLDTASDEERGKALLALANPEVVAREGELEWEEGCLSLPGVTVPTHRSAKVTVKAQDMAGNPMEVHGEGLLAIALQHEIDHLEGKLLLDHTGKLKRASLVRELQRRKLRELQGE